MREEVDLLEVPLLQVITAYLEDMESAGVIGYWDDMTEFLLLMSLLIEVKSRMLLPEAFLPFEDEELTPEQARDQLLERLFIYSQFKAAASQLREMGETNGSCLMRGPQGQIRMILAPEDEIAGSGNLTDLRDSLARVIAHQGDPDTSHLPDARVQLRTQTNAIKHLLASHQGFSFNKSFGGEQPLVQALTLFALLDMLSRGEVRVHQAQVFGDMLVKRREVNQAHRGAE
jgi:segregation and condensation protein A